MLDARKLVVGLGVGSLGCAAEVESCDLETDAIVMWATVTDSGERVEVEVEFEAASGDGAGTPLALCSDRDRLEVNGIEAELTRALGHLYYTVEFEGGTEDSYTIELDREEGEDLTVLVEMPPRFEITAPEPGSSHSRGAPLEIAWTPEWPGETVALAIEDAIGSDCIEGLGVSYEIEDVGSYSVAGNSLVGGGGGGSCEVTLSLTRSLSFDSPAALHEGGDISAFVRRRRPFTSVE